jgi:hypothetical protein
VNKAYSESEENAPVRSQVGFNIASFGFDVSLQLRVFVHVPVPNIRLISRPNPILGSTFAYLSKIACVNVNA